MIVSKKEDVYVVLERIRANGDSAIETPIAILRKDPATGVPEVFKLERMGTAELAKFIVSGDPAGQVEKPNKA